MAIPTLFEDPTVVNDDVARATAGENFVYFHPSYGRWVVRYGQFKDAVTYAAGQVCTIANVSGSAFTNDISGGSSVGAIVAGVALGVMTQNYYGFVLVEGYYPTIKTSGADDIAIGENLFVHGSTDGTCDGGAANAWTTANFGVAVAADVDADNTVGGLIKTVLS